MQRGIGKTNWEEEGGQTGTVAVSSNEDLRLAKVSPASFEEEGRLEGTEATKGEVAAAGEAAPKEMETVKRPPCLE